MVVSLSVTATGVPVYNASQIQWEHPGTVVSSGTTALLAFVGTVDAERPEIISATFSGQALQIIAETKGPGGDAFPAGHILGLFSPAVPSGIITVNFDETVGMINGFSVLVSGVDAISGTLLRGLGGTAIHPQLPDFDIDQAFIVSQSGILFDLCMAQSSRHTTHLIGPDQIKLADVALFGAKFSVSYRLVNSGSETVIMHREDCGGPFAGVSLTMAELKAL